MEFALINGSERPGGNTEQLAEHVARMLTPLGVRPTVITLREREIRPCGACGECNTRPEPCAQDDAMPAILEALRRVDGIVYMAPVHAYGLAQTMQAFIERAGVGYLRFQRPLQNKVAGAVVVGRRYGLVGVHNQIVNNMLLNRMILVGSGYPVTVEGGRPGKVFADREGLESLRCLIHRMVGMARLLTHVPPDVRRACLETDTVNERDRRPLSVDA